jgi:hypothetical protein
VTEPDVTTDRAHWAWRPVVTAVLALVAWSVSTYLHDYVHVPWILAILGAAIFDLSALILADLAHRATNSGDTAAALIYGTGVALFTAASAVVNWLHAQVAGWGVAGGILFAGAPIAAEILFVAQHWFQHRRKLRRDGKLGDALPRLGLLSWSFFPNRSRKVIKAVIESRLDTIETVAVRHAELARAAGQDASGMPGHVPGQQGELPGARPGNALPAQTLRLEIATTPSTAHPVVGQLVPARVPRPAVVPEPVLTAQAPDGQETSQPDLSIAQAVRIAIEEIGTDVDAVTARAAELKPESDRANVRREARRQTGKLPGTGLYM